MSTREIYAFPTTLLILRKYAQKALCTKPPLSRGVTGKTFTDTEKNNKKTHEIKHRFRLGLQPSNNRNCSITVGHSNVRGLYCNLNQIRFLLKYSKLDVFAITETHLNESIGNSELFIDGYCLWRLDRRDKKGGGVAFYVKRNMDCEIISKYE